MIELTKWRMPVSFEGNFMFRVRRKEPYL